ncbi:MAG TPA: hypothetical protein VF395_00190 [Polyangiaceae bacterium]
MLLALAVTACGGSSDSPFASPSSDAALPEIRDATPLAAGGAASHLETGAGGHARGGASGDASLQSGTGGTASQAGVGGSFDAGGRGASDGGTGGTAGRSAGGASAAGGAHAAGGQDTTDGGDASQGHVPDAGTTPADAGDASSSGTSCGTCAWNASCVKSPPPARCTPGSALESSLTNPRDVVFTGGWLYLYPMEPVAPGAILGVGIRASLGTGPTRAVFAIYDEDRDAHGPRPGVLLAQTSVVDVPAPAGTYDYPLASGSLAIVPSARYWVGVTYETDRASVLGDGPLRVAYDLVAWSSSGPTLRSDLSPLYQQTADGNPTSSIRLVVSP